MTHLITLCYSFSTSLCPPTGSLQPAYVALKHTTLRVGGLYLPLNPRHSTKSLKVPTMPSFLWALSGPTAPTTTANFCPQELCSQKGTAGSTKSLRSKRLLITERKASLHLLNDSTQRITADTCFSNKNHEYWSYARYSALGWDMVDKTNRSQTLLELTISWAPQAFPRTTGLPRQMSTARESSFSPPLHPDCGSFQVPQGRNQCRKPYLHWLQAKRTPAMKTSSFHIPAVWLINFMTLST